MTKVRGLCLASTATLFSLAEEQLWLHRPTHQGVLTRHPSLLSMAYPLPSKERYRPRTFYLRVDSHAEPVRSVVKEPQTRTVSLRRTGVPKRLEK